MWFIVQEINKCIGCHSLQLHISHSASSQLSFSNIWNHCKCIFYTDLKVKNSNVQCVNMAPLYPAFHFFKVFTFFILSFLITSICLDMKFSRVFLFICLRKVTICEICVMLTQLKGDCSLLALLYFHINFLSYCCFENLSMFFNVLKVTMS